MRKFWFFICDYYYIPLLVFVAVLGWVIFRRRGTPLNQTRAELKVIEAGRRARELEAEWGISQAKLQILVDYQEAVASLDKKQQAKAKKIGNNPAKLARFLVRVGADRTKHRILNN